MTAVSVLIPYRPSPDRDRLLDHVLGWWYTTHPDWQVVVGCHITGPWVKARAVADALGRATGDTLVLADADVLCSGVGAAVGQVQHGAGWATPHRHVYRLSADATRGVLDGGPLPDPLASIGAARRHPTQRPGRLVRGRGPIAESHAAVAGGGLVVLPRALYEEAPLDPRFEGWGSEDAAAGSVWRALAGPPVRGYAPCLHLHHPTQPRLSRAVGSQESRALLMRYRDAARSGPVAVKALLAEVTSASQ